MDAKISVEKIAAHLDDVAMLSAEKLRVADPYDDAPEDAYKLDACDTAMIREAVERLSEFQTAVCAYLVLMWGHASRDTERWHAHQALAALVAPDPDDELVAPDPDNEHESPAILPTP